MIEKLSQDVANRILYKLASDPRLAEMLKQAGLMQDIGNWTKKKMIAPLAAGAIAFSGNSAPIQAQPSAEYLKSKPAITQYVKSPSFKNLTSAVATSTNNKFIKNNVSTNEVALIPNEFKHDTSEIPTGLKKGFMFNEPVPFNKAPEGAENPIDGFKHINEPSGALKPVIDSMPAFTATEIKRIDAKNRPYYEPSLIRSLGFGDPQFIKIDPQKTFANDLKNRLRYDGNLSPLAQDLVYKLVGGHEMAEAYHADRSNIKTRYPIQGFLRGSHIDSGVLINENNALYNINKEKNIPTNVKNQVNGLLTRLRTGADEIDSISEPFGMTRKGFFYNEPQMGTKFIEPNEQNRKKVYSHFTNYINGEAASPDSKKMFEDLFYQHNPHLVDPRADK